MSLITRMLRQKCVYWPPAGHGDRGEQLFGDPEEIRCRWEDVHEQFLDEQGEEQVSNAKVYVAQDVQVGGLLRLGELSEVPFPYDPRDEENDEDGRVLEIRKFEKLPNLRDTENLRTAML